MNTIGVSCPDFGKFPFEEMFAEISGNFKHWEIFSEIRHYAPLVSRDHCELLRDSGMTFSIHTGIADINVASTNELIRSASVANLAAEMKAANVLGVDTVTIHPGVINLAVKGIRDRSVRQANLSMKEIERYAEEYGVHACIENMPNIPVMLGVTASELSEIIDGTDLPICFDIGHANTSGQIDAMLETFGTRIHNVHIHDNLGERDDHMTIGDGKIDFDYVLNRMKWYPYRYIIECRSMESARISQSRLRLLLSQ